MPGETSKRVSVIGVGPGDPDQVTVEAVAALRAADYLLVLDRSGRGGMPDPLVAARGRLLERHLDREPVIVRVVDPEQVQRPDREAPQKEYDAAVARWHLARREAFAVALESHPGAAGVLVWGDPGLYDSTNEILAAIHDSGRLRLDIRVIPGISSVQLLAARHRLVLQEVGQALHITSARKLREALAQGQDNLVVMLNRTIELDGLEDWRIWWGANLGTAAEELVAGRVGDVLPAIEVARSRVQASVGWVLDIYLLRQGER